MLKDIYFVKNFVSMFVVNYCTLYLRCCMLLHCVPLWWIQIAIRRLSRYQKEWKLLYLLRTLVTDNMTLLILCFWGSFYHLVFYSHVLSPEICLLSLHQGTIMGCIFPKNSTASLLGVASWAQATSPFSGVWCFRSISSPQVEHCLLSILTISSMLSLLFSYQWWTTLRFQPD